MFLLFASRLGCSPFSLVSISLGLDKIVPLVQRAMDAVLSLFQPNVGLGRAIDSRL